jgi:hypothetical protein
MAPFKSTQSFSVGQFLKTFRNRDGFGPAALNSPVRSNRVPPLATSGGTKTTYGSYTVHSFLSSGSFVVENAPDSFTCDILVVGGGGAGGSGSAGAYEAGGGGAGGMRTFPGQSVGSGIFTVTVGDGGTANQTDLAPNFGGYSELATPSPLRSEGGGVGGMSIIAGSGFGGSGGGCRRSGTPGGQNHVAGPGNQGDSPSPSPVPSQGNAGGAGYSDGGSSGGGGGGGAGGAGAGAGSNTGGAGGVGLQNDYRTGSNVYYAGGGGGTGFSAGGAAGGSSIGGSGGNIGGAGATNTGSGGGGGDYNGPADNGGDGGPGIVVVRYLTS